MLARKCVRVSQFPNIASIVNRQSTSMTSSSIEGLISSFSEFKFSPSKLLELPVEDNRENYVRRFLKGVVFSRVNPTPLSSPVLVAYSEDALVNILDLDPSVTRDEDFVEFVTGNSVLPDSTPLAHRYGGHQFGVWASQLGDGRAIILGEYHNRKGERWELQLKGSGLTPYSRDGDGRAVLRSSIREFLCSEAMYYLGIPTSRAATIVVSEDRVVRDPFYDGNPRLEPAAVVLRLAQSWFRIGSLEILGKYGETELLNTLLNFILKEHFPDIPDDENKLVNFLKKVYRLSSDLVVKWQMVGFTHGVLNSDNMSLLGITIDYGPFGFMESYDPLFVPNHSDSEARYCYGRQIQIVLLNMLLLTKAVSPIMPPGQAEAVAKLLQDEAKYVEENMMKSLSEKLGFPSAQPELVMMLTEIFEETKADFNMSFREMSENPLQTLSNPPSALWGLKELAKSEQYKSFLEHYSKKLADEGISDEARMEKMCQINPRYVLRNWMAESAIRKAEKGDYSEVSHLLNVLKNPFSRQEDAEKSNYAAKAPGWAKNLCLSCSS